MERIAADATQRAAIRQVAEHELERVRGGGAVDPGWQRVRAAIDFEEHMHPDGSDDDISAEAHDVLVAARTDRARRIKENRQKRASAAARAYRSMRSFTVT